MRALRHPPQRPSPPHPPPPPLPRSGPTRCLSIPSPYQLLPISYYGRTWVGVGRELICGNQTVAQIWIDNGNGQSERGGIFGERRSNPGRWQRVYGGRAREAVRKQRREAIPVHTAGGEQAWMRVSGSVKHLESMNKKNIIDIVFFLLSLHRKPKTINNQKIRLCQNFFFWAMRQ